jgi:dienelactone hydrolase
MMKILALSVFALFAAVEAACGADVVIVPHDKGYYTSLARHVSRWLASEGVVSAIADAEKPGKAQAAAASAPRASVAATDIIDLGGVTL